MGMTRAKADGWSFDRPNGQWIAVCPDCTVAAGYAMGDLEEAQRLVGRASD
jgi:hypothetical protein